MPRLRKRKLTELPNDYETEAATVGCLFAEAETLYEIDDIVKGADFYDPFLKEIFEVARELILAHKANGQGFDIRIFVSHMKKRGSWSQEYLRRLQDAENCMVSTANAMYYAKTVSQYAEERRMILKTNNLLRDLQRTDIPLEEKQEALELTAAQLLEKAYSTQTYHAKEHANTFLERSRKVATGISTGFDSLDHMIHGVRNGEYIVIGARPGIGKSSLALNMAVNMALQGKRVLFFSIEMLPDQLMERAVSYLTEIPLSEILENDEIGNPKVKRVQKAIEQIKEMDLIFESMSDLTPSKLRLKFIAHNTIKPVHVVFVDYLQLMHLSSRRSMEQHEELQRISNRLRSMALEFQIPLVLISQLRRNPDDRKSHRPTMADLRGTGAIEQDAHKILLLHREGYYKKRKDSSALDDQALCIIEKQRQGQTGDVTLGWDGECFSFYDLED